MFAVTFVPQQKKIALIFGPQRDQDCSRIWTPLNLTLQPYLDPNMTDIAIIRGPPYSSVVVRTFFKIEKS